MTQESVYPDVLTRVKGRTSGSPLARGFYSRAITAEVAPRAKPGAPADPVDSVVWDNLVIVDVEDAAGARRRDPRC